MIVRRPATRPRAAWHVGTVTSASLETPSARRVVLEAFRASVDHDITEWADRLRLPVHLVAAEHDDITTVDAVRRLQAMLPDATMAVIPDVGHLVHYETPRDAAEQIAAVAGLQTA